MLLNSGCCNFIQIWNANSQCITMINTRVLCTSRYIWWSKGHIDSEAIHSNANSRDWRTRECHFDQRIYLDVHTVQYITGQKKAKLTKTPLRAGKKENFKWLRHRGCPFRSTNISRRAQSSIIDHCDTLRIASESMCPFDHQIYLDVHRIRVLIIVAHCVLPQSQSAFSRE